MKRLGYILILPIFIGVLHAALVYDPVTNTYKSGTGTTTAVSSGSTVISSGSNTSSSSGATTTGTSVPKPSSSSLSFNIPDPSSYKGTLSAMHIQLDNNIATVLAKLDMQVQKLNGGPSSNLEQASDRIKVLSCLGIITPTTNVYDTLRLSADSLYTSIGILTADMHSEISALEQKIDKQLLDQLIQQLEISSMQNKIDSFLTQYSNVIDLFFEVSAGKVEEIEKIFTNVSTSARKNIEAYDANSTAYNELMAAYNDFLSKSSFAGATGGPSLNELIATADGLKTYRRSKLISERQDKVLAYMPNGFSNLSNDEKKQLLQDFSLLFNEKSQSVLGDLYPIDELLVLNQQIISLRSAYTDAKTGFADCKAFVENPMIKTSSQDLQTYMDKLLEKLTTAASKISSGSQASTDKTTLLKGLSDLINSESATLITDLITTHKTKLGEKLTAAGTSYMSFKNLSKSQELEGAVRKYLQNKYLAALQNGTIAAFQDKLQTISTKITAKIASNTLSSVQSQQLGLIQNIVIEFLE